MAITGVHALFYTTEAEAARAFIRDKLRIPWRDEGEGWLVFKTDIGEIGCHPADAPSQGVTFMCDDIESTIRELEGRGVACTPVHEETWGWTTTFVIPGGGDVVMYQPKSTDEWQS